MAEGLPADVKKNAESMVVASELGHTEEGEFCSSEAAEIFGMSMFHVLACTICILPQRYLLTCDDVFLSIELIRDIRDPERSESLEALSVVRDDLVSVRKRVDDSAFHIRLEFVPTVPHCSLATTIGGF